MVIVFFTLAAFADVAFPIVFALLAPASDALRAGTVHEYHKKASHDGHVLERHRHLHRIRPGGVEEDRRKESKSKKRLCGDAAHKAGEEHQAASDFYNDGEYREHLGQRQTD